MSVEVMSRVWKQSKSKENKLLTLLAIADNANDDGWAYPSQETLAKKVRVGKRALQKLLDALEEAGEVIIYNRVDGGNPLRHFSNVYHLAVYGNADAPHPSDLKGEFRVRQWRGVANPRTLGVANPRTLGVANGDSPDPLLSNHHLKQEDSTAPKKRRSSSGVRKPKKVQKELPPDAGDIQLFRDHFDSVSRHIFGITSNEELKQMNADKSVGGRIGSIASWLSKRQNEFVQGNSQKKLELGYITRPAKPEHVAMFCEWYKEKYPKAILPRFIEKFIEYWREWGSEVNANKSHQSRVDLVTAVHEAKAEAERHDDSWGRGRGYQSLTDAVLSGKDGNSSNGDQFDGFE